MSPDQSHRLDEINIWDLAQDDPNQYRIDLNLDRSRIRDAAISHDHRWVIAAGGRDMTARIWDLAAANPNDDPVILNHDTHVLRVAISRDNHWVATVDSSGDTHLWEFNAGAAPVLRFTLGRDSLQLLRQVTAVTFSQDSRWLACGGVDRNIRLWDLSAPDPNDSFFDLSGHSGPVTELKTGAAGIRWMISASTDEVCVWDLEKPDPSQVVEILDAHENDVTSITVSRFESRFAIGSLDGTASVWRLNDDSVQKVTTIGGHGRGVSTVSFSSGVERLATGSLDGKLRTWGSRSGALWSTLTGHEGAVLQTAFTNRNRWIVSLGSDGIPRLWIQPRLDASIRYAELAGGPFALSPNGRWLYVQVSFDHGLLWSLTDGGKLVDARRIVADSQPMTSPVISPNSRWLYTPSVPNLLLFDLEHDDPVGSPRTLLGVDSTANSIEDAEFTDDGNQFAVGVDDNLIVWDLTRAGDELDPVRTFQMPAQITSLSLTPEWLVAATHGQISGWRLVDAVGADPNFTLDVDGTAFDMKVTADQRWLIAKIRNSLFLWPLNDAGIAGPPLTIGNTADDSDLDNAINDFSVSRDGRQLATIGPRRRLELWDLTAPDPTASRRQFRGHGLRHQYLSASAPIPQSQSVSFGNDSRTLISQSGNELLLWNTDFRITNPIPIRIPISTLTVGNDGLAVVDNSRTIVIRPKLFYREGSLITGDIHLWNLGSAALFDWARQTTGRNLTHKEWSFYFPDETYQPTFPELPH